MTAILIVDDDAPIREVLRELFEEEHTCHTAANGEQALEWIKTEHYDVILMDVSMPGMSGLELLAQTRLLHPQTPVIIITGIDYQQHSADLLRLGAFDYLVKPFVLQDAEARVSQAVLQRTRWLEEVKESAARAIKRHQGPSEETVAGQAPEKEKEISSDTD